MVHVTSAEVELLSSHRRDVQLQVCNSDDTVVTIRFAPWCPEPAIQFLKENLGYTDDNMPQDTDDLIGREYSAPTGVARKPMWTLDPNNHVNVGMVVAGRFEPIAVCETVESARLIMDSVNRATRKWYWDRPSAAMEAA